MSLPDTIFIFALALVIFGPKKLPEIGRQIGKLVYEFRRASNEFKLQIEEELRSAEEADRQTQFAAQTPSLAAASVVSSEISSSSSGPLTVHPPSTGTQVSADSPSHNYSSAGEENRGEEAWDSWSADGDLPADQTQGITGEAAQETAFEQPLEHTQEQATNHHG